MHGYLVRLVADRIEILPPLVAQLREQGAEARYARPLRIVSRNANRKVEPGEDAAGLASFRAKPLKQRGEIAHGYGSGGRVMTIRAFCRLGAPPLAGLATPISVADHGRLDG